MAITALILVVVGVGMAVLSFMQRVPFLDFTLPRRQVRRIWLPVGLILVTLGGLFGLSFMIAQPGSPVRILETQSQMTQFYYSTQYQTTNTFRNQQNAAIQLTNSAFTATAVIQNATNSAIATQTASVVFLTTSPTPTPTRDPNISDNEATATAIIANATRTVQFILTGTAQAE